MLKKTALLALLLLTGIIVCTGCRPSSKQEIVVYTALESELIDKYLKLFRKSYPGIGVKIVRDSTGIITAKMMAEGTNTPADVIWGTAASSLLVLEGRGMLEPYAAKGAEKILPLLKDSNSPPAWIGIAAWESAIVVNTEEARSKGLPEVSSYQDLLNPQLKGQIIMSNPNSSNAGFLFVSGLIQLMGEDKAFEYMDRLHENVAMYLHSGSASAKKTAAGEFAVGISFGYASVSQVRRGYPVKVVFPSEGSGWDVEANALVKKGQIKDEAKYFLDWAISQEAMAALASDYAITGIKTSDAIPYGYSADPVSQLIQNNDLRWAAENRDEILRKWTNRYDGKTEGRR